MKVRSHEPGYKVKTEDLNLRAHEISTRYQVNHGHKVYQKEITRLG